METPQDLLLQALVDCLPEGDVCLVDEKVKQKLADAVRKHYKSHPEAINMQASGNTIPPTVDNHK
jgi:coproporphyrinogen III oxidase